MNKIVLVLGLVFLFTTILLSGCVTNDVASTNGNSTNNIVTNDTTGNSSGNVSTDNLTPPEFPKD